jgi:hypothetical protein
MTLSAEVGRKDFNSVIIRRSLAQYEPYLNGA